MRTTRRARAFPERARALSFRHPDEGRSSAEAPERAPIEPPVVESAGHERAGDAIATAAIRMSLRHMARLR
jgi:hypothetical protein